MTHINWYAQLEKLKILEQPVTPEIFEEITSIEITESHLEYCLDLKPQMNQLVQELLALGISSTTLAEHFRVSRATISYHKKNPVKSEYINYFMNPLNSFGLPPSVTQINIERRPQQKRPKDAPKRKRRTKVEVQRSNEAKLYVNNILNNMFTS